jgi:trimethylamine--corrinoid protein Co-methyltransferase
MRPKFELLNHELIGRIVSEAFLLLEKHGVRIGDAEALGLVAAAGGRSAHGIAYLPRTLVERSLRSVPREFFLYDRAGNPAVHYGGDDVHFDPGSSCLNILDPLTEQPRPATAADLIRLIHITEGLPEYAAQSTAVVCNDVPAEMGDWYRLLLILLHSNKPMVTGAFNARTLGTMLELLAADSGGFDQLRLRPRAVFDVCPSPPLNWSDFASRNLIELARHGVPAEMIPMPLAGATAPVTLAGAIVQHAAESLAGITIHQLARQGSPIVWGGAPAIFDMSTGNTPMGAIETAMLNVGCAQIGKSFGLPTHGYMVASDGRFLDAQAGAESASSAVLGALAGINMISGAGMLDFLACHSVEKLVIDAEAIASAQRLISGVQARTGSLAVESFARAGSAGNFLQLKETRALFREEQHFPSAVTDRSGDPGVPGILSRARARVNELLSDYRVPEIPAHVRQALLDIAEREARSCGVEHLPSLELAQSTV